jgi:two-component system, cell cycle response regulator
MQDDSPKTVVQKISDLLTEEKPSSAYLIVVAGSASVGKMYRLDRGEMVIGRSTDADIRLDDDGVSRNHAKIVLRADGSLQLIDLGSTNGTFYNGGKIDIQTLKDGDKIQIGSTIILKFSYQDTLDEALQRNLYDSATRDGLTHLYNKKYFLDAIAKEFAYADRHKVPLALVMIDVDHFKRINDTYGHQCGDYVLQRLGQLMTEAVRAEDVLVRYGGEEFAILLRECIEDQAVLLSERLRRMVESAEFVFNGQRVRVTISLGIAALRDGEFPTPEALIASADQYLYRAKENGRNKVDSRMLSG